MTRIGIIGGGASGTFLAFLLGQWGRGRKDLAIDLYEGSNQPLRKLRATGNGRCNFTNMDMGVDHYTGEDASFVGPALEAMGPKKLRKTFASLGIDSLAMESGMVYPKTLRAGTLARKLEAGLVPPVKLHLGRRVEGLKKEKDGFSISFEKGEGRTCDILVLASGGSYGLAKNEWSNGYSLARDLGHEITPLHAGIVSLRLKDRSMCKDLSGLMVRARLSFQGKSYTDDLLFTDYGLSGMVVLKASNRILDEIRAGRKGDFQVDFFPDYGMEDLVQRIQALTKKLSDWTLVEGLNGLLQADLLVHLLQESGNRAGDLMGEWDQDGQEAFCKLAKAYPFSPQGSRKKDHGQVTCGGISTRQVDPTSLESQLVPSFYLLGELLDVQGECGGYNLHWAFASAYLAFQSIKKKLT